MKIVLYVHGLGGNADECKRFEGLFEGYDVMGLDYKADRPWIAREEFREEVERIKTKYDDIVLIANSIGAYFSLVASLDDFVKEAFFISPVTDMEKLILNMMSAAEVTEEELRDKGEITTASGVLSYQYLIYTRENPIKWNAKTHVLYGGKDTLISLDSIRDFAKKHRAAITIMQDGEHWFHTQEQLRFLDEWICSAK